LFTLIIDFRFLKIQKYFPNGLLAKTVNKNSKKFPTPFANSFLAKLLAKIKKKIATPFANGCY
jgi:hypothetical protein